MAKYTDVSIDLETLGTRLGSCITQIGLCAFSANYPFAGAGRKEGLQLHVNAQEQIDRGALVDWSTVSWWLQQEETARNALRAGQENAHDLEHALHLVNQWFREMFPDKEPCVWGYGATFDVAQLEIAYQRMSVPMPWNFRNVRDLRTLVGLHADFQISRPRAQRAHIALDDAVAQAEWVQTITAEIHQALVIANEPECQP